MAYGSTSHDLSERPACAVSHGDDRAASQSVRYLETQHEELGDRVALLAVPDYAEKKCVDTGRRRVWSVGAIGHGLDGWLGEPMSVTHQGFRTGDLCRSVSPSPRGKRRHTASEEPGRGG